MALSRSAALTTTGSWRQAVKRKEHDSDESPRSSQGLGISLGLTGKAAPRRDGPSKSPCGEEPDELGLVQAPADSLEADSFPQEWHSAPRSPLA
jgi:hypothetical protein